MPILPASLTEYARSLLASPPKSDPSTISDTVNTLSLEKHIEGGYFVETDRDSLTIPNPFKSLPQLDNATIKDTTETRNASTTIFYQLTHTSPMGRFHRNRGRTVHTLHWGRGTYVLLHFDELESEGGDKEPGTVRMETFNVGHDITKGEKLQWIVEGGKFKASFLLPDTEGGNESAKGLLISETVVPGFDYRDHDFMTWEKLLQAVGEDKAKEMRWLLNLKDD
jgi:uncharacterized protein